MAAWYPFFKRVHAQHVRMGKDRGYGYHKRHRAARRWDQRWLNWWNAKRERDD